MQQACHQKRITASVRDAIHYPIWSRWLLDIQRNPVSGHFAGGLACPALLLLTDQPWDWLVSTRNEKGQVVSPAFVPIYAVKLCCPLQGYGLVLAQQLDGFLQLQIFHCRLRSIRFRRNFWFLVLWLGGLVVVISG